MSNQESMAFRSVNVWSRTFVIQLCEWFFILIIVFRHVRISGRDGIISFERDRLVSNLLRNINGVHRIYSKSNVWF